jgi:hypothetical protein
VTLLDAVNMNGQLEQIHGIWSTMYDSPTDSPTLAALCYTPLGRAYYTTGTLTPTFTPGVNLLHGQLQIAIARSEDFSGTPTGLTRTVIIPDSGSTRIVSR